MFEKWHDYVIRLQEQTVELRQHIADLKGTLTAIGQLVNQQRCDLEQRAQQLRLSLEQTKATGEPVNQLPSVMTVLGSPNVASILISSEGSYLLFNEHCKDVFGDELISSLKNRQKETQDGIFFADKSARCEDNLLPWQKCARGAAAVETVLFIKRADVHDGIWIRTMSMPIQSDTGSANGAIALIVDITEQVNVKEQINSLLGTLEQQLTSIETGQELMVQLTTKLFSADGQEISPEAKDLFASFRPMSKSAERKADADTRPAQKPTEATESPKTSGGTAAGAEETSDGQTAQAPVPGKDAKSTNCALIVDDIPVNQKLLSLQLARFGFDVEIACNGKEAVNAVVKKDYDIVFMDLDMPIMDGPTATAEIRRIETVTNKHVPIVAMTSYKREVDRQRCLNSGMDDYLTKGANGKQLLDVINVYVKPLVDIAAEPSPAPAPEPVPGVTQGDLSTDTLSLKALHGDQAMHEISRLFYSSVSTFVDCLQLAIEEKNSSAVVHFSHCIKGPASSLGLKKLENVLSDLIAAAESAEWVNVGFHYMKLRSSYSEVVSQLRDLFGPTEPVSPLPS